MKLEERMQNASCLYGLKVNEKHIHDPRGEFKDVITVEQAVAVAERYALEKQQEFIKNFTCVMNDASQYLAAEEEKVAARLKHL